MTAAECAHLWEDENVRRLDPGGPADYELTQSCWKTDCDGRRELRVVADE